MLCNLGQTDIFGMQNAISVVEVIHDIYDG